MSKKREIEYVFDEKQYKNQVMLMADRLCGTSCQMSADAIIEYCSRPDISQTQINRIIEAITPKTLG
jgi:Ni,Fe-hydrogenase III large subunit